MRWHITMTWPPWDEGFAKLFYSFLLRCHIRLQQPASSEISCWTLLARPAGVTDQHWCDGIKHDSLQDMQRQEEGEILLFYQDDSWSRANFLRSCRGVVYCWVSCVHKYTSFTIHSGLPGPAILCSRGLHYAHSFVFDPNLDIFWNQRDKVGTLFGNSVNSWSFIPIPKF